MACQHGLNCHFHIQSGSDRLKPVDALVLHQQSREWLANELAVPFAGKTVVITHHGIGWGSVAPKYREDILSAGFASDMTELVEQADLWIHGHTHHSHDFGVGKCRVVVNPRGYPAHDGLAFENKLFNSQLVVDI